MFGPDKYSEDNIDENVEENVLQQREVVGKCT